MKSVNKIVKKSTPKVRREKSLDKLDGKVLFKEKLEWANDFLKKHPIPKDI